MRDTAANDSRTTGAGDPDPAARQREAWVASLVLTAGGIFWTVRSVLLARRLWFFGDDFDFLLNRSVSLGGEHGLLVPHNEHWSTIPILVFRLNYALFGLHHYLPYALVPILFHLLVTLLVYQLLRRCQLDRWVAVLATLVVLFSAGGAGAENVLWDFQVGFLGSCLWALAALTLLGWGRGGSAVRSVVVVALVFSLMSSAMGIVMVLWVALYLLLAEGLRSSLVTVAVPAGVYITWYVGYGHGHSGAPPPDPSLAPLAAMQGLASIWSAASGMPGAGPAALVVMVAAVVVPRHDDRLFALAGSGLVAIVAAYALLGYSRSGIGIDATVRSRYIYFGVVLTVPALAAGLHVLARSLAGRRPRAAWIAWLAAAAVVVSVGSARADRWTVGRVGLVSDNLHRVAAAGRLVKSGAPLLRTQPMPQRNPDVTVGALRRRSVQEALPDVKPGVAAELYVEGYLQVDVARAPRSLPGPGDLRWRAFSPVGRPEPVSSGCQTRIASGTGVVEVSPADLGSELRLTVQGTEIGTQLSEGAARSPVIRWPIQAGVPVYVDVVSSRRILRIHVPAGPVTVCAD